LQLVYDLLLILLFLSHPLRTLKQYLQVLYTGWYSCWKTKLQPTSPSIFSSFSIFCVYWCYVLRWLWCLWCYSKCASTPGKLKGLLDLNREMLLKREMFFAWTEEMLFRSASESCTVHSVSEVLFHADTENYTV
jgi:hypothetical protein